MRKNEERKEREEQERLKKERQEQYRLQEEKLNQEAAGDQEEQEEEPLTEEYLVYICQCCHKKFNTTNQFVNHSNSKKHRYNAKIYEEAGVIVTEVQLRRNVDDGEYSYEEEEYEEEYEFDKEREEYTEDCIDTAHIENDEVSEGGDEEEEGEPATKVRNIFAAFADDSDSSSSSSSSDSSDEEDEDDSKVPTVSSEQSAEDDDNIECDDDDDLNILEEIIYQNRLQDRFFPDNVNNKEDDDAVEAIVPVPLDDEWYNPDKYNVDGNRIASIQHRLQKRSVMMIT